MNNSFSISRFALLLKKDFTENMQNDAGDTPCDMRLLCGHLWILCHKEPSLSEFSTCDLSIERNSPP